MRSQAPVPVRIHEALATGQNGEAERLAHTLKGVAAKRAAPRAVGAGSGAAQLRAAGCRAGPAARTERTAVVVEDAPVLARSIRCFLALEGFQVRLAANRAEVVAGFRAPPAPDVVLLDVTLPDADGFEVLLKVREHPRLRHVPVLMLTGRATRGGVLLALRAAPTAT